jgi:hypothetical protein
MKLPADGGRQFQQLLPRRYNHHQKDAVCSPKKNSRQLWGAAAIRMAR